jgi:aspartate aminotransferase
MKKAFAPRLDYILNALAEIEGVTCVKPRGAFYVFPNVSAYYGRSFNGQKIAGSLDMADYLLAEYQIAIVPGIAFGADRFIRFSFATSMEVIEDGMKRFKEALARLA